MIAAGRRLRAAPAGRDMLCGGRVTATREQSTRAARNRARRLRVVRRRRLAAIGAALLAAVAFIAGIVAGAGGDDGNGSASAPATVELPRGGTELLPRYRMVGFYGAPQDEALGTLGIGSPAEASARLEKQAQEYERAKRPAMPFMELVAAIANADPGADGLYRSRQPKRVIDDYLEAARAGEQILVLDVQPGRADFPDEVDVLRRWLREPDVGLGLDPEWHVGDGEVPGQVIGSVDAAEVNRIAAGLSRMVERNDLPQKLLIVHQFTADMIVGIERLRSFPGVAVVLNVDGFGDEANKVAKYDDLHPGRRSELFTGFKLFFEEDLGLMRPGDVLGLRPPPDVIVYE